MQVTHIIKNMTDAFFNGNESGSIVGLLNMTPAEAFAYLNKQANGGDLRHNITQKVGRGSFGDKVDLNAMLRGAHTVAFKLEPRKGYKLATFTIAKA
jgi:hypothetical protein